MIEELILKDIELNQKIKPIMERKGIEHDWAFNWEGSDTDEYEEGYYLVHPDEYSPYDNYDIPAWRLDKILLALPDWCFVASGWDDGCVYFQEGPDVIQPALTTFMDVVCFGRGQEQLESAAKLLILLEENDLNE